MSKQLEKVYLLNVLLYIDSLESVKKFITINKKCKEVSTMLRLYTKRRRCDYDLSYEKIIPYNLFTIFPTIQTIVCDEIELREYSEIMKRVTFIHLHIRSGNDSGLRHKDLKFDKEIPLEIRKKVQLIKYDRNTYKYSIPFNELFPNCKILICNYFMVSTIMKKSPTLQLDKLIEIVEERLEEYDDIGGGFDSFDSDDSDFDFDSDDYDDYSDDEDYYEQTPTNKEMNKFENVKERINVLRISRGICGMDGRGTS